MRLVLQRVEMAAVEVAGEVVGEIGPGLLVLVGVARRDDERSVEEASAKIAALRMFSDTSGKSNLDIQQAGGAVLVVSQFTLLADTRRGRRPSFVDAATSELAAPLVEQLIESLREAGLRTAGGRFGAAMRIRTVLDGPFTIELEI